MLERSIRVAIVYDAVYPWVNGGAEKRIADLVPFLVEHDIEVHIYGMKWWEGPKHLVRNGVHYHGIMRKTKLYGPNGKRRIIQAIAFGVACLRLTFEDFDVVDCCSFPFFSLFSMFVISRIKRKPLLATWIEVWGPQYWRNYLGNLGLIAWLIEFISSRLPDHIISISQHTSSKMVSLYGLGDGAAIDTVPPGIDMRASSDVCQVGEIVDLIYVGRLVAYKNVDVLINAVSILRDRGHPLKLTIVGHGPEYVSLIHLVERLRLLDLVAFKGHVEGSALAFIKAARILVQPSSREGFGIVALESFSCGVPVITVDEPDNAIQSLVTPDTGIVTKLAPDAIADAVMQIISSRTNWKEHCRKVANSASLEKRALEIAEIYSKLNTSGQSKRRRRRVGD